MVKCWLEFVRRCAVTLGLGVTAMCPSTSLEGHSLVLMRCLLKLQEEEHRVLGLAHRPVLATAQLELQPSLKPKLGGPFMALHTLTKAWLRLEPQE